MTMEFVRETLAALRQKYGEEYGETLDRMMDCEENIQVWAQAGAIGEIPCMDELRSWGVPLPESLPTSTIEAATPPESGPSDLEVESIIGLLEVRLRKTTAGTSERDDVRQLRNEIRVWQQGGQHGSLPHEDRLRAWGIWPVDAEGMEAPKAFRESYAPPVFENVASPVSQRAEAGPLPRVAKTDTDDALRGRYDDALLALEAGQLFRAKTEFRQLQSEAHGVLAPLAREGYVKASTQLTEQTRRLADIAANETNLDNRIKAWRAVLAADPAHDKANSELNQLEIEKANRDLANTIDTYLPRAQQAADALDLVKLNEVVGAVEVWKTKGEKTPPELSQDLYTRLVTDEKQIKELQATTRDMLGAASTYLTSGRYREAYRNARNLFERGVPYVIDETGALGSPMAQVEPSRLYREAREKYLTSLRSLVAQRITSAESQEKGNPETALKTLSNAEGLLAGDWQAQLEDQREDERASQQKEGPLLTKDDLDLLEPERRQVSDKRKEVLKIKERYDKANAIVMKARSDASASRAVKLGLLRQAHTIYPDYPGLDGQIEAAEDDVAEVLANEVHSAIVLATSKMKNNEFQVASELLANARSNASLQIPRPKPGSRLQEELDLLRETETELADAEGEYNQLMALLQEIDDAVARHEAGDAKALGLARAVLEQLTVEERRHSEARKRQARLSDFQDAEENWRLGQKEYRQSNWQVAETYLRKVALSPATADKSVKQEATRMADRALAGVRLEEGRRAEEEKDWNAAFDKYADAQSLLTDNPPDPLTQRVLADSKEALQRLKNRKKEDEEAQVKFELAMTHLEAARRQIRNRKGSLTRYAVESVEDFKKAADILSAIVHDYPHTSHKADQSLQEVRELWRSVYLEGMRKAAKNSEPKILEQADSLARELEANNLLYEEEDVKLARELKRGQIQAQYTDLLRQKPVNWEKVEANRKTALADALVQNDELQQQYFDAVRERVKGEVGNVRRDLATGSSLARIINDPSLRGDRSLFPTLIDLCWELRAWDEAEQMADELAFQASTSSNIWLELTRAGRWLSQGQLRQAKDQFEQLRVEYGARGDLLALINDKQREFSKRAKDYLRFEAAEQEKLEEDDGYVRAAELYAQAAELAPNDRAIATSLESLGSKLKSGIEQRCVKARGLKAGQRPLQELTREADALHTTLAAIQQVSDKIDLPEELADLLAETLDDLDRKRSLWKVIHALTSQAEKVWKDALKMPTPLPDRSSDWVSGQSGSRGGWDFQKARNLLQDAKLAAGRDPDCLKIVENELKTVELLETRSREIENVIQSFREALWSEEFEQVANQAKKLSDLWRGAHEAGWDGLAALIRVRYDHLQRDVESLDEHEKQAGLQKSNLALWSDWATKAKQRHMLAASAGGQIHGKEIDELKDSLSLDEVALLCQAVIKACDDLDRVLNSSPQTPPLSRKAKEQGEAIPREQWTAEAMGPDGFRAKAVALAGEAKAESDTLNMPLNRLRQIMVTQVEPLVRQGKPIPANVKNLANRELKLCRAIDPLHEDVVQYGKRLTGLS